ncbi:MAG: Rep protein [CRESS virus sp. ct0Vt4]|uniref:Replication-associated protein n=1 Tax=CRESS virus sp. ct0Vt4 TaxID=2656673 RepID=A0A5Q2WBH7_9VIRU|nr:MAG: Rep protein [CRESS virus sp. ct0Vt4]
MPSTTQQGRYWLLTIPQHQYTPYLPSHCIWIRGQLERGEQTEYVHWQLVVCFKLKTRLGGVRSVFGNVHAELSRSAAANDYVWKQDTYVDGTRFELGQRPVARNSKTDWDVVWKSAVTGDFEAIPSSIRVSSYAAISRIKKDHLKPVAMERYVSVYVGPTGVGKSRRAWSEAGFDAYPKDPNTKFWDGYQGQAHVVMDEFRGKIDISNILRWTDRYPVSVETKGSGCVFSASKLWITSNLHPMSWYPDLDAETKDALMRRLNVEIMDESYYGNE